MEILLNKLFALDDTERNEGTINIYVDTRNMTTTWLTCLRANNHQFIWYCWLWTSKKNETWQKNTQNTDLFQGQQQPIYLVLLNLDKQISRGGGGYESTKKVRGLKSTFILLFI